MSRLRKSSLVVFAQKTTRGANDLVSELPRTFRENDLRGLCIYPHRFKMHTFGITLQLVVGLQVVEMHKMQHESH